MYWRIVLELTASLCPEGLQDGNMMGKTVMEEGARGLVLKVHS